jgi:carotenoid cleavage dioxygenase
MEGEYLRGVLAPVEDELELRNLKVRGEIPSGLRGTYLRNGPNPAFPPAGPYHLWDGDGMIHALAFDDDGAHYRNRWVATPGLALEREHGRSIFSGLLDRSAPPSDLVGDLGAVKNVANTNIVRHAGRYLALWEAGLPTVLTQDLDTVGQDDFAGRLAGGMTAHPKIDPVDGEMLFFGYSAFAPHLRYHVADRAGKLTRSVEIDLPGPVMIHDFVVTREHVVFFDSPAAFDFQALASGGSLITWKPELGTRIGVMPRSATRDETRWFEVDNCYVFHFLNAYSEGDVVRVFGSSSPWLIIDYANERAPDGVDANAYLCEYRIDLAAGSVARERIGELPGEFCKVPDAVAGLKNRYGYLASFSTGVEEGAFFDSITKYDLVSGRQVTRGFGRGKVVGEPAFAPDPQGSAEDDGWLVFYLHERDGSASEFVVLDARDVTAEPVARIPMPRRVPLGFHGNWMTPE